MENKGKIKVNLSTVLLILAIGIIIMMGYLMHNLCVERSNFEEEINALNSEINSLKASNQNYQDKINSISNTINSGTTDKKDSNTAKKTDKLSNEKEVEIKEAVKKYFDMSDFMTSDSIGALEKLGLKSREEIEKCEMVKLDDRDYVKTDIKYSDFKNAIEKYMSIKLFNKEFPNAAVNKDEILYFVSEGGTALNSFVKECKISNDGNMYKCDVILAVQADDTGEFGEESYTLIVVEQKGRCVVSDCKFERPM